ncbi:MAG TPA: hypothetical protein VH249_23205 [Xanthobacteraceae bacterium]|jgi:hypothetical protein|nr:hypothetical protein [Xanthobacteraceae bacterium]
MKRRWVLSGAIVLLGWVIAAAAQERVVQRSIKAAAGKDVRVGAYINVLPDCSSGPLPTIRLVKPPAHGQVTVKKAKVNATNYKQCLALDVPGYVAFYRSAPDFTGDDPFTLEVRFPGRTELQEITVSVQSLEPSQRT